MNGEYLAWYKQRISAVPALVPCAAIFCGLISPTVGKIVFTVLNIIIFAVLVKHTPKAKKAFVITARVKRLIVTSAIISLILAALLMLLLCRTFFRELRQ